MTFICNHKFIPYTVVSRTLDSTVVISHYGTSTVQETAVPYEYETTRTSTLAAVVVFRTRSRTSTVLIILIYVRVRVQYSYGNHHIRRDFPPDHTVSVLGFVQIPYS